MNGSIGVGILGGTGYGAGELLRLLAVHPEVEIASITSRSRAGQSVAAAHPHLEGFYDELTFSEELNYDSLKGYQQKVVFTALPHGVAGETIAEHATALKEIGAKVIDLSGAHRLGDDSLHKEYYPGVTRSEALTPSFVYGLTELNRETIAKAEFIANPGCLATASILSLTPILNLIDPISIVFDTKTGSSGSGRELKETTHHPTRHGNFTAYKPLAHQHEPEVLACLKQYGLKESPVSFVAQSLPIARGIYVTTHLLNETPLNTDAITKAFQDFAEHHSFIRYREKPPHLQHVVGTNFCDVAVSVKGNQLIVMTAIDNLVKGMAGQAIQNANLMCNLPEETSLLTPSPRPY